MTQHLYLRVPYDERGLARDLGAIWCPLERLWYCNTTQFRSRAFKRWRDKRSWRRITIHPDDTKQGLQEAKRRGCLWDKASRTWFVDITDESTLKPWHRARLTPPTTHELRVAYAEKETAKEHGARWDAERGSWVVRSRAPLSPWLMQRVKVQGGTSAAAAAL